MNWSTVKNLLIAMLAAANVFLIYNISVQNRTKGYLDEKEVADAVGILAARGLEVDAGAIPLKRMNAAVCESFYPTDYFSGAAEALSGHERESAMMLPDGGMMIITVAGDSFEFYDDLGFVYYENSNVRGAAYTDITADDLYLVTESCGALTKAKLSGYGKRVSEFLCRGQGEDYRFGVRVDGGASDDISGVTYIFVTQMLDGLPVCGNSAVCVFDGDELLLARGFWYFGTAGETYGEEIYDQVNILFTDLSSLTTRIAEEERTDTRLPGVTSVTACYTPNWNADRTALYFIPSWQIEHTDGTQIVYNAVNNSEYLSTR